MMLLYTTLDCRKVKFSTGGQYFALSYGRKVSIFKTYPSLEPSPLHTFSYHTAQITSVHWSPADDFLYSSAIDCNLNLWDIRNSRRVEDYAVRMSSPIIDFSFRETNDRKGFRAAIVSECGKIVLLENDKEVELDIASVATCVCFVRISVLVVGFKSGKITIYNWPATIDHSSAPDLTLHCAKGSINCIRAASSSEILICGNDSTMFLTQIDQPLRCKLKNKTASCSFVAIRMNPIYER